MVRPPTPSASTWWRTTTRATRSPGSAPTRVTDHSGASRLSGLITSRSAVSMRACSSPGAPQSSSRTCCRMSNRSSSTQTGPPQPNGTDTSRCRSRGTARIRSATRLRTRGSDRLPSSSSTTPNCSGTGPLSIARKARSEALARSIGAARTGAGAGARRWLVTRMPPANAWSGEAGRVQGHRRRAIPALLATSRAGRYGGRQAVEQRRRRTVRVHQGLCHRPAAVAVGDDLDAPRAGEADLPQGRDEALDVERPGTAQHPVVDGVVEQVGGLWCWSVAELDDEHLVAGDLGQLRERGGPALQVPDVHHQTGCGMVGGGDECRGRREGGDVGERQRLQRHPGPGFRGPDSQSVQLARPVGDVPEVAEAVARLDDSGIPVVTW